VSHRIIGICGYKGSGKSEVAKYLIRRHGYRRFPFAQTLKDMLRTLGLTDAQVDGDQKEVPCELLGGRTPRWAMQSLGTEWGRQCIDQDLWVRAWKRNVPQDRDVVVDDLRFLNEAKALVAVGAELWRIDRPGCEPIGELHPSEAYVMQIPVHYTVFNASNTISDLHISIESALNANAKEIGDTNVRKLLAQ
jgi:hypothetical protein